MGGTRLTIATWNVNGLRARAERVAAWLDVTNPDIVMLQETKCDPEQVPAELFASRGYLWSARGAGGRNGVLVASRVGLDDVRDDLAALAPAHTPDTDTELPDLLAEPRFLSAGCGGLRVASVYAPNGREVDTPHWHAKLHWYGALQRWSASALQAAEPLVLGGDFNVAPNDTDVWDPAALVGATHVSTEERAAWRGLIDLGLVDAAQAVAGPGERAPFTWWDYRGGAFHRGWGMRIDHLLVDPRAGALGTVQVDREGRKGASPSDHAALSAVIERGEG
jgi:exodeoxyribonuclease-3